MASCLIKQRIRLRGAILS